MQTTGRAYELAEALLSGSLPRRWAHTQGVTACARQLGPVVGDSAEVLETAAVLHDVGYAPPLVDTGFHPLDGARHLRTIGVGDDRVVRLVANHSFALLEAEERGLREVLEDECPLLEDELLTDALVYCDMTTTPDGSRTSAVERVAEIRGRYGDDSVVGRFIRRASPGIFAAVARVEAAVSAQPR